MNVSVSDFFLVKYASDIFAATGKHLFLVGWAIFFASGITLNVRLPVSCLHRFYVR
jgi:hypothetical protein